jgi:hypothetical protein
MLERIQALEAEIKALRAEAESKKSKPWEPWKPDVAQAYWHMDSQGNVLDCEWRGDSADYARFCFNNCFPTEDSAKRHDLRLRSMRPTCLVPKVGDVVYCLAFDDSPQPTYVKHTWRGRGLDHYYYNRGVVFASIEALDAWIAEFGDAWTTLEDEAK